MQICACVALGFLARDADTPESAVQHLMDALTLATTHPPFAAASPPSDPLERMAWAELEDARVLLATFFTRNLAVAAQNDGRTPLHDTFIDPHVIVKADGSAMRAELNFIPNICHACGRQSANLPKCSRCSSAMCASPFIL